MRVLVLSPFLPYPSTDGARVRIYEYMRGLVEANHEVEVIAFAEPADTEDSIKELRQLGFPTEVVPLPSYPTAVARAVASRRSLYGSRYRSAAFKRLLSRRLGESRFDLIQCDFYYMGGYCDRTRSGDAVWLLQEHNVEFKLASTLAQGRAGLKDLPYRVYVKREIRRRRAEELAACRAMDHVVTMTEVDREILVAEIPGLHSTCLPTGVDVDFFDASTERMDPRPSAVYVGKMDYRPNIEAVHWFCDAVLPSVRREIPEFEFRIVGQSPPAHVSALGNRPGIEVTGWVEDVRPYLQGASVVVVPLLAGSGIRVKILDSLSMRRPVITTTAGYKGLPVIDGEQVVVADRPDEFARAVIRLTHDPIERAKLGANGRRFVEENYSWARLTPRLNELYVELVSRRHEALS